MKHSVLCLEPPIITVGLYVDRHSPAKAFGAVCDAMAAIGAIPTGIVEAIRAPAFPVFTMASDLAELLEVLPLDLRRENDLEMWKRRVHGRDPTIHVLRAAFDAPSAGLSFVEYGPAPEVSRSNDLHPLAVTTSGALLSMPAHVPLNEQDRERAAGVARFLLAIFRSTCETLDPLYGMIGVEASLPTPNQLASDDALVGTELYVSNRLGATDHSLEGDLAEIYARGYSEHWRTGLFLSGWSALNPAGHMVSTPLKSCKSAARRLSQAMPARSR